METIRRLTRVTVSWIGFLATWLAVVALGYIVPMNAYDHGGVMSAFMVMIYLPIAAIVGLLPASLVEYAIHNMMNHAPRP